MYVCLILFLLIYPLINRPPEDFKNSGHLSLLKHIFNDLENLDFKHILIN